ncbi:XRE family transcriptional regulator [Anaerotruncus sp. 80]|uniref:XRE family transcriptional regulator n=1 Tax=Anaerotruncus colihominis TaxID=169435 RepID=A0A845QMW8_9FIRM|nr:MULTISPECIES: helix-turn-helix transcriptional regulator [Anaerotruncus]NBH62744.1 XRE family transcriptional regulator [Anaerotruncus colihominis]NCF03398.1 XRE family transcriptional regulator [Anaerotruncus sp. 80]
MFKKLEKLLEERQTTIYRVAKETGIPDSTLYEWKSGKYVPKIDKIKILADYFGVPIEYFLEE